MFCAEPVPRPKTLHPAAPAPVTGMLWLSSCSTISLGALRGRRRRAQRLAQKSCLVNVF